MTNPVLDACCGSRMMWFDRKDARAATAVSSAFGIPVDAILGRRRTVPVVEARFALYALLHEEPHATYLSVSRLLTLDCGTIRSGILRARELAAIDPKYAAKLTKALDALRAPAPAPVFTPVGFSESHLFTSHCHAA